jgi:hypothetical protein
VKLSGPEAAYQWKFGRGAECVKYAYAAQAKTAATTMRRMLLAMVKRLLLSVFRATRSIASVTRHRSLANARALCGEG